MFRELFSIQTWNYLHWMFIIGLYYFELWVLLGVNNKLSYCHNYHRILMTLDLVRKITKTVTWEYTGVNPLLVCRISWALHVWCGFPLVELCAGTEQAQTRESSGLWWIPAHYRRRDEADFIGKLLLTLAKKMLPPL